jgi:hypothetical protein
MNDLEYNREQPTIDAESMLKSMEDREKTYHEEELSKDLNWLEASGKIYQMDNSGKKFQGSPQELAQYGIDRMSRFNYNATYGTITDTIHLAPQDDETKIAFAYLMDTYDKKDITLDGFGRAMLNAGLDPLTYIGLGTFGIGMAGKQAGISAAKQGVKEALHNSIKAYLKGPSNAIGVEASLYSAGDEIAKENVYQKAGMMKDFSPEAIGTAATLGYGGGVALSKTAEFAVPAVSKGIKAIGQQIEKGIDYIKEAK